MVLTGITLTGADDSVDAGALLGMTEDFPFVEWGILIGSRLGSPRFPTERWLVDLGEAYAELGTITASRCRFSLHICGGFLRSMINHGIFPVTQSIKDVPWQRCQLNFHGQPLTERQADNVMSAMLHDWIAEETIVQLDGVNDWLLNLLLKNGFPRVAGLYDRSSGAGVLPHQWPTPNPKWEVGYAGGLGPENVGIEIRKIGAVAGHQRFWIDMETKLRSDDGHKDIFDLRKCRQVLQECGRFFETTTRVR